MSDSIWFSDPTPTPPQQHINQSLGRLARQYLGRGASVYSTPLAAGVPRKFSLKVQRDGFLTWREFDSLDSLKAYLQRGGRADA